MSPARWGNVQRHTWQASGLALVSFAAGVLVGMFL